MVRASAPAITPGDGIQPVGGLMMLVNAHTVIPECICKFEFIQIAPVEFVSFFGVKIAVGENQTGRGIFFIIVQIQWAVRH